MEHIAPLNKIPRRTKAFARLWATKFIVEHPTWHNGETGEDTWYCFGDYDINLYCDDGYLSVCAYPLYKDENGSITTDNSNFVYLVRKGVQ
jgi:hypothetical protein